MPRSRSHSSANHPANSENTNTAQAQQALANMASSHIVVALTTLTNIAAHGQSKSARVSTAYAILNKYFSKPQQTPFSTPLHSLPENPLDSL